MNLKSFRNEAAFYLQKSHHVEERESNETLRFVTHYQEIRKQHSRGYPQDPWAPDPFPMGIVKYCSGTLINSITNTPE